MSSCGFARRLEGDDKAGLVTRKHCPPKTTTPPKHHWEQCVASARHPKLQKAPTMTTKECGTPVRMRRRCFVHLPLRRCSTHGRDLALGHAGAEQRLALGASPLNRARRLRAALAFTMLLSLSTRSEGPASMEVPVSTATWHWPSHKFFGTLLKVMSSMAT